MTLSWFPRAARASVQDRPAAAPAPVPTPRIVLPPEPEPRILLPDRLGPWHCPQCRVGWAGEGPCWVDERHQGVPGFVR